jgi:3-oxoacyl-[acyl-carrier protein] reductase
MRFRDKIAVVTGAASGFGAAIAKCFAAEGARVVVADVDEAGGEEVAAAITDSGGAAISVRVDVSRADQVKAMIDAAVAQYGGLDILVNNAGFSHHMMPLWDLPEEDYDRVFAVNTKGVYLGAKYAVPALRERGGGVIVNTASIGAVAPRPGVTAYNATKGARRGCRARPDPQGPDRRDSPGTPGRAPGRGDRGALPRLGGRRLHHRRLPRRRRRAKHFLARVSIP